jgi:hypothetical protein
MTDVSLRFKVNDDGSVVLDKISQGIQRVDKNAQDMTRSLGLIKVDSLVNLATRAFSVAEQAKEMGRSIAAAANDIERNAKTLNMTIESYQKWSYAAKMADVEVEGLMGAVKFQTRSMAEAIQGTGDATKAYQILGINLKDTTGKTKDQQTVMFEVIDALGKYADGVNKDALMLAIFGRSWMSIKPLINEGTAALKENMEQAEKWNLIIGKDSVQSLSQSEKSFKQWSETVKVTKIQVFGPMVEILGSMIERVMELNRALKEGSVGGVYKDILQAQERQRVSVLAAPAWVKEWVAGYKPPVKPEVQGIPGEAELKARKFAEEKILEGEQEVANTIIEAWASVYKVQADQDAEWIKNHELADQRILEGEQELANTIIEAWNAVYETQKNIDMKRYEESTKIMQDIGSNIANIWTSSFSQMRRSGENFGDWFKKLWLDMADYAVGQIMKIAANYALMGNVKGTYTSGAGLLGWLGSLVGLQEGGQFWINRPTMLYPGILAGEGGRRELVTVTPESKTGQAKGGDTYVIQNYNQVNDPNTFVRLYGPVVKKLSEQSSIEAKRFSKMSSR